MITPRYYAPAASSQRPRPTRRTARSRLPLRRFKTACRCTSRVAPSCAPSREGPVPLGVLLCERPAGTLGSLLPARPRLFSRNHRFVFVRRPRHLSIALHPPVSFPPPPECYGLQSALRVPEKSCDPTDDRRAPPMGSSSLIAASTSGVHHPAGNPNPTVTFRPRRFSRPRRFTPPPAFAGLFHPAATSRVCPSGVSPSSRSRTGFPPPSHALLPLNAPACGLTRASLCALAFRALLPAPSAVPTVAV